MLIIIFCSAYLLLFFSAQSFVCYALLCAVFAVMLACRQESEGRHLGIILRQDGWKYAILGLIDVEANYLVVKAYTYTTITSVQVCSAVQSRHCATASSSSFAASATFAQTEI